MRNGRRSKTESAEAFPLRRSDFRARCRWRIRRAFGGPKTRVPPRRSPLQFESPWASGTARSGADREAPGRDRRARSDRQDWSDDGPLIRAFWYALPSDPKGAEQLVERRSAPAAEFRAPRSLTHEGHVSLNHVSPADRASGRSLAEYRPTAAAPHCRRAALSGHAPAPDAQNAFGQPDPIVNGLLFDAYHLHRPWSIRANILVGLLLAYPPVFPQLAGHLGHFET